MGITETRVNLINQDFIHRAIVPQWSLVSNSLAASTGRIWVLWNSDRVNVDILISNPQLIHVRITSADNKVSFEASFIYAFNYGIQRVPLWVSIRSLARNMGSSPWIVLGDFNVTLFPNEILGIDKGNAQDREDFWN